MTLETALHATVDSLFRGPLPDGIQLDLEASMSYPAMARHANLIRP